MRQLVNLDRYPLDRPAGPDWNELVRGCRADLARGGMFNLPGFIPDEMLVRAVDEVAPTLDSNAFTHARRHNIYFQKEIDGLDPNHLALSAFETSNRTICADQMSQSMLIRLYEWPPFAQFLAAVMDKPALFTMADALARVNVMAYSQGQALNWHFDRSEFTTTLLLQAPTKGGTFEYARDLRRDTDPNFQGVAELLRGRITPQQIELRPGTLNVFKGRNTAHRVSPVIGARDRIIAVFSFFERSGVQFSEQERIGFYGRAR